MGDARFRGIFPSTVTPFGENLSLDEGQLARHLKEVSSVNGVSGILCNGHAGENWLLTRDEHRRVVAIARSVVGKGQIIVAGVNRESSLEAAQLALDAAHEGADAILVFPPPSWALSQDRRMAAEHHRRIAAKCDLPIVIFQGSVRAGQTAYRSDVLAELVQLPTVVAVKEGSWETSAYDANRRLIKAAAPHVAVMASGDEHLLTSYVLGSEGSLVSLAIVCPEAVVNLDRAVQANDLSSARKAHEKIYPLSTAIYGASPGCHVPGRLKVCLKLLHRLARSCVRAPLAPIETEEIECLRRALLAAGLLTC